MAQSVTRRIERNLTASVAFEPGQLIRPRSAESIKASGYVRPRRKAGHMTASDHCSSRKKFLQAGGHPHMRWPYLLRSSFAISARSGSPRRHLFLNARNRADTGSDFDRAAPTSAWGQASVSFMIDVAAGIIGLVGAGIFLAHAVDAYWAQ
jgi:hypothetical protein